MHILLPSHGRDISEQIFFEFYLTPEGFLEGKARKREKDKTE
jgi:hypothetical protein